MEGHSSQEFEGNIKSNKNPKINKFSLIKSIIDKYSKGNKKDNILQSIVKLVNLASQKSFISTEEQKMINNIIKIDDIKVSDIMIPRANIIAMPKNSSLKKIKEIIIEKEHTRMPIYGENLDEIIGFIHSKDLVKFLLNKSIAFELNTLIRKIIYAPHSMRIVDLLRKMRFSRVHIAIVLDEYGVTDGLVTIEDIVEEIVGEIEDEHDFPDNNIYNKITKVSDTLWNIGARVPIEKVEELISYKITSGDSLDFETIGGFLLSKMKKVPEVGESITLNSNISFKILEADSRSIKAIEVKNTDQ